MERLVRKNGAASLRTRTVLRRSAFLIATLLLAGSLAYAVNSRSSTLATFLPEGSYPLRVSLPDLPEALRNNFTVREDIPALAIPPELAVVATPEEGDVSIAPVQEGLATPAAQPQRSAAGADFLTSFSDLSGAPIERPARPSVSTRPAARTPNANDANVLDINYDLLAGPGSSGAVEISKRLRRGDASLGPLKLQVDRNAGLYASRADLARMLPARAAQIDRLDGDYLSLSRLREAGVNLRYDAAHDELVLQD